MAVEITSLIEKANALGIAAEAHDKVCSNNCDEPNHECFDTRLYITALVMDRLGMSIVDIGFVADKLLDIQCEDGCGQCAGEQPDNDWPTEVGEKEN